MAQNGQFIDQTDIHVAIGVFQDFFHLSNSRRGDGVNFPFQYGRIHLSDDFRCILTDGANHFRRVLRLILFVARINALRRKA